MTSRADVSRPTIGQIITVDDNAPAIPDEEHAGMLHEGLAAGLTSITHEKREKAPLCCPVEIHCCMR